MLILGGMAVSFCKETKVRRASDCIIGRADWIRASGLRSLYYIESSGFAWGTRRDWMVARFLSDKGRVGWDEWIYYIAMVPCVVRSFRAIKIHLGECLVLNIVARLGVNKGCRVE